jgi:hypothetical protein
MYPSKAMTPSGKKKEKNMKDIKLGTVNANFAWMLREHHGWTELHSAYVSSRAEFNKECDEVIVKAADDSSNQPILFDRAEFMACKSPFDSLAANTTHILVTERNDIAEFTDEACAQMALDEAMREHGLKRLTCDRGGHAGETERVDVSDIDIVVYVGNDSMKFHAADLTTEFKSQDVLDKDEDLTSDEVAAILEILQNALAELKD